MTLELRNIVKKVGAEAHIYDTSLELVQKGFNILLGTTLSGKTTLMQIMAGLDRPSSGEIWFNGQNVTGVAVQKRNVSMVYQQFINYPNFSVFENIASSLRVARIDRKEIKLRVEKIADLLKLTPMLDRKPAELSGGQQQRTALARALVKDSDLVLLDEPLANLDFKLREELRDELPKLFADRDCTVVYATTEPTEALLLGGHTAALHEGRVTQFGPTSSVYRHPDNLTTAQVFSEPPLNTAQVVKSGNKIDLSDTVSWTLSGDIAEIADGPYTVGIRPHLVTPEPDDNRISMKGRVQIAELSGSESVIHFSHGDLNWISQSNGVQSIEIGEEVPFFIDVQSCLFFAENGELIEK
ncbi:MAG: ABC transporter ATP-binding protein [Methyloligellaceae bacterium]